jgi:YegS/Rv2252/BmrU family lipid kinase
MTAARALPKQAILIVNTKSRSGRDAFDRARELLTRSGVELIAAKSVKQPSRIKAAVEKAIANAPMVIIGGGDGTLSSAIDLFKNSDTVFAILPLGTANSFARALGLPLGLEAAVKTIAEGVRRKIDLGCINGDYFGNSAAVGLSPMIAKTIPRGLKKALGRAGYLIWAVRVAAAFRPFKVVVSDGRTRSDVWASEVRIANGGYFGGVDIVHGAELDSGEIIVEVVATKTRRQLLASWLSSAFHLRSREEGMVEFRGRKLHLTTEPEMDVAIDGELATRTPITVAVAHNAVEVAVPNQRD